MSNSRFSILLIFSALVLFPSYVFASAPDTDRGISGSKDVPSTIIEQKDPHAPPVIEQNKTLAEHHVQEAQNQNLELPKPEIRKEHVVIPPYSSNPVATKAVDRNISLFAERIKERFSLWLNRSGRYIEMMKEILKAKDMPEDIAFLPLIESGFNPSAYSVARAVGQWQFIASTAKRYGLKIDWWRDERRDPVKSTEAAADYLKDLYGMFGSWNLAMAAYNAGEGRILKALNRTKKGDYWALLNTRHIKRETKEYVPRFIAAHMIANNPRDYGFENVEYHPRFEYDEVLLHVPIDLEIAARCAETTLEAIKELNPELRRWSTPPNVSYALRIPAGKKDVFNENLIKIPAEERFTVVEYTVKKGDTFKSIANNTGLPLNVILDLNGTIRLLKAGETVYLPPKGKFYPDRDDKKAIRTSSKKNKSLKAEKQRRNKKLVVASLSEEKKPYND